LHTDVVLFFRYNIVYMYLLTLDYLYFVLGDSIYTTLYAIF